MCLFGGEVSCKGIDVGYMIFVVLMGGRVLCFLWWVVCSNFMVDSFIYWEVWFY